MYRSNAIIGDAEEFPAMEEVGDHHDVRTDDNLRYFRLLGLQHSNKTNSEKVRRLLRGNGVRRQFVRSRLRLWSYYLRPLVGVVRSEASAVFGNVCLRNLPDPRRGSPELADNLHMSLSRRTVCQCTTCHCESTASFPTLL